MRTFQWHISALIIPETQRLRTRFCTPNLLRLTSELNGTGWQPCRRVLCSMTTSLNRQNNLHPHVLSLLHELAVDQDLVGANSIAHRVRRIGGCGNLDFPPLAVGWYELTL